jgi:hypothetical protein
MRCSSPSTKRTTGNDLLDQFEAMQAAPMLLGFQTLARALGDLYQDKAVTPTSLVKKYFYTNLIETLCSRNRSAAAVGG